ncbi:hypothetical protein BH09VER1_BH09VER1_29520 [soil metagenome]
MKHRNIIGSQIRSLRYQRGWSQEQLAAKLQLKGLDISRASLGRIENGQQAVFDYEILAFCHVFHVSEPALHPSLDPASPDFHRKFLEFVDKNSPRRPMNTCSSGQLSFEQFCSRDEQ